MKLILTVAGILLVGVMPAIANTAQSNSIGIDDKGVSVVVIDGKTVDDKSNCGADRKRSGSGNTITIVNRGTRVATGNAVAGGVQINGNSVETDGTSHCE